MHALSTLTRLFPYWGLVVALTFLEIGMHYYRRGMRGKTGISVFLALVFIGFVAAWFAMRGDLNSGAWVRAWFGS